MVQNDYYIEVSSCRVKWPWPQIQQHLPRYHKCRYTLIWKRNKFISERYGSLKGMVGIDTLTFLM